MSGNFDVTGATSYLSMSAGSSGAVGSGAYTIAVLCQPAVGNNNAAFAAAYTSGTANRALFEDTNLIYGNNDFSSGFGTLTQGTWYLLAQTKAGGSNTYRHHIWAYAAAGTGTMSHGVSTGSGNQGDGSAATELRIGANVIKGNGLIAVVGYWTRALSDAELDSMKSGALTAWRDVSGGQPSDLISLETWNGSAGATAVVGTSTLGSVTGTVSSGSNPPSFNFTLSSGTTYNQNVSGGVAPAGVLARQAGKRPSGSMTPAGSVARRAGKNLAGTVTPSGAVSNLRLVVKLLSGAITPAGVIVRSTARRLSGSVTPSGALVRRAARTFTGAVTPAGALSSLKAAVRAFSGSVTPAGTLARRTAKTLGGTIAPGGSLRRLVAKTLAGTLGAAGTLVKQTAKRLTGALAPAGAVQNSTGPPPALRDLDLTAGPPEIRWTAGVPGGGWTIDEPVPTWTAGLPEV